MKLVNLTASELDRITELLIVDRAVRWNENAQVGLRAAAKEDLVFVELIDKLLAAREELTHQYAN